MVDVSWQKSGLRLNEKPGGLSVGGPKHPEGVGTQILVRSLLAQAVLGENGTQRLERAIQHLIFGLPGH